MTRIFIEKKLLIASGNKGKISEISQLLAPFDVEVVAASRFQLKEPEEVGKTFAENAILKARYYGQQTQLPALADDSGLCVEALDGAPGIYSARWAGPDKDFSVAMKRIEEELAQKKAENHHARFICALALYWPDGHIETFEGSVEGQLVFPPCGELGFGYDPIFIALGDDKTFAQISPEEKHAKSHRADAFNRLVNSCFKVSV